MGIINPFTSASTTVAITITFCLGTTIASTGLTYDDDYLRTIDNNGPRENQMDRSPLKKVSFVAGILIVPIAVVGILGNVLTIYVFTRRSMACSINTLLAGLAVIDGFLLLIGTPLFSIMTMYDDNDILQMILNYLILYAYPLALMAQSASVWCIVVITLERFVAVLYPLKARIICTIKNARIATTTVITLAISYNFCRFWEYDISNDKLCYILRNDALYLRFYVHWLYFFVIFFVPFAVLLVFNGLIINELKRARLHRAELTRQQSQEHKIALMMVIVILIFFVCNSLAFVLNAIEATQNEKCYITQECTVNSPSNHTVTIPAEKEENVANDVLCVSNTDPFYFLVDFNNLLIEINSSVNFIVYYAFSQRFRKHCHHIFSLLKLGRHHGSVINRKEINSENIHENELRSLLSAANRSIGESASISGVERPGSQNYRLKNKAIV